MTVSLQDTHTSPDPADEMPTYNGMLLKITQARQATKEFQRVIVETDRLLARCGKSAEDK